MGEVYRAQDARLGREVAVKVLPAAFSAEPTRLLRFEQEARAAAALNHPNILNVLDIGTHESAPYVVFELLEGQTLREAMPSSVPLPTSKAIEYARQVSLGLAAAHAKGITHRDIKPENLFITSDGHLKILDFGLAKLTEDAGASGATRLHHSTEAGVVLGTVGYMSPEQVRGQQTDGRSDIFSVGVVLFEMLAGKRPFAGDSAADTMSAILNDDPPDLALVNSKLPPALDHIVRHCLEKRPGERFQSAKDLAFALQTLSSGSTPSVAALLERNEPPTVRASGRRIPIIAGGLAMLLLAGAIGWGARSWSVTSPPVYRTVPLAVEAAAETAPAWSPDGKTLAYSAEAEGHYQIFTRQPDQRGGSPAQLTTLPQDALFPFWHPSGDKIYFFLVPENALWVVGAAGGQPERVVENVFAGAISPDGASLVLLRRLALWTASPDGSNLTQGPELPEGFNTRTIKFSPDGRRIGLAANQTSELWLADYPLATGGFPSQVVKYLPPTEASSVNWFDWMPDGRQVIIQFVSEVGSSSLWLADLTSPHLTAVTQSELFYTTPSVSLSGRIAYAVTSLNWDIRQIDLNSGAVSPLISSSLYDGWPAWLPSGEQLAYSTARSGRFEIWMNSVREGWNRPVVTPDDFSDEPTQILGQLALAPNGRAIAYQRFSPSGVHLFVSPMAGGKPVRVDSTSVARQDFPAWSPDSNWLVFSSQGAILKVRVGSGTPALRLRDDAVWGDIRWSRAGQILYRSREGVTVMNDDGTEPRVISSERLLTYDWAPDGARVFATRESDQRQLDLITINPKTRLVQVVAALGLAAVSPEPTGYPSTIRALAISPDGKRAAFAFLHPESDIWMLEQVKQ